MNATLDGRLIVAISSRALFDFEEENRVFETQSHGAYQALQRQRLDIPAPPGVAFSLVRKLLAFNQAQPLVEVVIVSRNDPVSGLRVFRSAKHYGLAVERGVFTRGRSPWRYLRSIQPHLFLSAHEDDARSALAAGVPAARVLPESCPASAEHPDEVRIAFDGDAVLFSDEAERIYRQAGLDAFQEHERDRAGQPLPDGPFKPFLRALHRLQQLPQTEGRIRTALVTARCAPAHERAIRTLMEWNVDIDEALFLGGLPKGAFLKELQPDLFFDDQTGHIENAAVHVPSGHVASGVANEATV